MIRLSFVLAWSLSVLLLHAPSVSAQSSELGGCRVSSSEAARGEREPERTRYFGSENLSVRFDCDDMQFFADFVELFKKTDIVAAQGHVVFVSGGNRISADRMEFNTRTRTGTFYNAYGTALLGERVDRSLFGTQEPYAFFWGERLEKLGPAKYKITRGGFTTCVQPTPRWEIASGSITVNLDDYALLTNSVFRVKGVPVMYLPVFYYPIQEDDRATGFLLPTYGTSTIRGQSISNAFFWAISRSQDATLFHDWFSRTGQGYGGEYRYVAAPGSEGNTRFTFLNEKTIEETGGTASGSERSSTITGSMTQRLPASMNARANVYYFSSIASQQTYQQNIFDATNRRRNFSGNVTGAWGPYVLNATVDRNDYFSIRPGSGTDPALEIVDTRGGLPRISFNRGERPIGGSPVYFGVSSEFVTLLQRRTEGEVTTSDQGLSRVEVAPTLRIPFSRWPFLTVNSAASWRGTYWTESLDPTPADPAAAQVPTGIGRRFFDLNSRITGPVFTRIFDNPGGGYAERFKHVIEPSVTVQRITAFDEFDRIVKLEGTDFEAGNLTRFIYGLTNRVYAKKAVAREILSVAVAQTYVTDANAARFERDYQNGFTTRPPTKFLPIAFHARATPVERIQADFRTEYDVSVDAFTSFAASGTFSHRDWLTTAARWTHQRRYEPDPAAGGFRESFASNFLSADVSVRARRNTLGGTYAFNYDLRNDRYLQQRWVAYYNAQCCGIGVEYQTFNFRNSFVGVGVPQDRRFNLSFTLAGIGTFSNLFGAFGGQQGR